MDKKYSIIIPVYNGSHRLYKVLDSLCRQSTPPETFEVIIVDDGSDSKEREELRKVILNYENVLNIKVIERGYNAGPAAARNSGIENAQGEYYFFTDDDCEVPAMWIETHMNTYKMYPNISAVCGWYKTPVNIVRSSVYHLFNELRYLMYYPGLYFVPVLSSSRFNFNFCNTANFSLHSSVAKSIKFDEQFIFPGGEDAEYGDRLSKLGFVLIYIPYFVLHNKEMSFMKFVRLAKNRAYGVFIRKLTGKNEESVFSQSFFSRFLRLIDIASEDPLIRKKRFFLRLLAFVWFFHERFLITEPSMYFYWKKKIRRNAQAKLFKEFEEKLTQSF